MRALASRAGLTGLASTSKLASWLIRMTPGGALCHWVAVPKWSAWTRSPERPSASGPSSAQLPRYIPVPCPGSLADLCSRSQSNFSEPVRSRSGGRSDKIFVLAEEGAVEEIVAASAGNHAQGVALAASLCDLRSTVFMPAGASLPKVEATRNYGANVHFVPGNVDDAIAGRPRVCSRAGALSTSHPSTMSS